MVHVHVYTWIFLVCPGLRYSFGSPRLCLRRRTFCRRRSMKLVCMNSAHMNPHTCTCTIATAQYTVIMIIHVVSMMHTCMLLYSIWYTALLQASGPCFNCSNCIILYTKSHHLKLIHTPTATIITAKWKMYIMRKKFRQLKLAGES